MKIAISGGTGFVGRPLVARLLGAGRQVVLLTRRPKDVRPPPGAQAAFFDATQPFSAEQLGGADAVIHLAGETVGRRWNEKVKAEILESRAQGTATLAQAAVEAKTVKVFLSASGTDYYPDLGNVPQTEESPPGPHFLSQVCVAWEGPALALRGRGIRAAVFRMGIVLHPEGGALARMLLPFKLGVGGPMGSGDQYLPYIHREDVVRLYEQALTDERFEGPINAVAPQAVTNRAFVKALGRALHRPAVMPVPSFALKTLFSEMAEALLSGRRVVPQRLQQLGFDFRFGDIDAALGDLLRK